MTIDQTRNEIEEEIKSKNVHEQRLKDDTALLEQQTEVYNTTTKEMEQHIARVPNVSFWPFCLQSWLQIRESSFLRISVK